MMRRRHRAPITALNIALALSCPFSATMCAAQTAAVRYNITAQPLNATLKAIARQGRVQILFSDKMVRGLKSQAVKGEYEPAHAFDLALKSTGLYVRRIDARTYIVMAASKPAPVTAPMVLNAVPEPVREVIVVGSRVKLTATNRPLNDFETELGQLNAVSILSRTDLSASRNRNVTETLGILPGMTVLNTGRSFIGGIDSASRGEGLFTAFRGMNSEFSLNTINGVAVAQALPYSRGMQLSLLPASGFQSIAVSKTQTADMDGDVIGGHIDFRTPTAFDFKRKSHLGLTLTGRLESRARDYDDSGLGSGAGIEFAHRFGRDQKVGLYIAAAYDRRTYTNSELAGVMAARNDNGWAFARSDSATTDINQGGINPNGLNPQDNLALTSLNIGLSTGVGVRRNAVMSVDWRARDDLNLYLYATQARAVTEQNSTFSQIISGGNRWQANATGSYDLTIDRLSTRVWYETNPDHLSLSSLTLGAHHRFGRWTLSPNLFFSEGQSDRPDHIEASMRIDQVDSQNKGIKRPFSGPLIRYIDQFPQPVLTPEAYADLNDASSRLIARRAGQLTTQFSRQTRSGGRFDALYESGEGNLMNVRTGFKYTQSQREVVERNWTNRYFGDLLQAPGLGWDDLGITRGVYRSVYPGRYNWSVPQVDHDTLMAYFRRYETAQSFDSCGTLLINNLNCNTQEGTEKVAAAYLTATFQFNGLEFVPGVRFEQTRIDNTYWVMPQTLSNSVAGHWESNATTYRKTLPGLLINYRPDANRTYRAAVWQSYIRPAFVQLGSGTRYETSDDGIAVLRRSNPDLKTIDALNADLSYQQRWADGSTLTFGAYHKQLDHYIYESKGTVTSAAYARTDGKLRVIMPRNGGRGQIYGLEAEWHKNWQQAAGDIGLKLNLSRQWTRVDLGVEALGRDMPIQNAPEWLANSALSYDYKGFQALLIYNYTSAYLADYNVLEAEGIWDNLWVRPVGRLDLQAAYRLNPRLRLEASLTNLNDTHSYWAHIGKHSLTISDIIDSGRSATVSLKYEY